jgi:hypothetical protein
MATIRRSMGHILRSASLALVGSGNDLAITLLDRCNQCGPTRPDGKPRCNNVDSGAINVGRRPQLESMIVGQEGCSIAIPVFNSCEPQGRHEVAEVKCLIADWASTERPWPYGRGVVSHGGVSSRPSTPKDRRPPPLTSRPGKGGSELHGSEAVVEASLRTPGRRWLTRPEWRRGQSGCAARRRRCPAAGVERPTRPRPLA